MKSVDQKIQIKHPAGKKAVCMDKSKYYVLKKSVINNLRTKGGLIHSELFKAVTEDIRLNKISFKRSVEWHPEWVKPDLEAGNEIKRKADKLHVTYTIPD
jgi:Family of unknown function (DUF6958)